MLPALRLSILLAVGLSVVGCGSNFVRPDDNAFALGQATYSQVLENMGPPRSTSERLWHPTGKRLKVASYVYTINGLQDRPGIVPVRSQEYWFYEDVLVARIFTSSFAEDSTDWNESNVDDLVKGKTSRAEVIDMLGRPSGAFIWPASPEAHGEALGYSHFYMTTRVTALGSKWLRHSKTLVITFDEKDRILDFRYRKDDEE